VGSRISPNQFYNTSELENLMQKEATYQNQYANTPISNFNKIQNTPGKGLAVMGNPKLVQSEYPHIPT
jgi:hypothetical protein